MDRLPQHPPRLHSHSNPTLVHQQQPDTASDGSNPLHSAFFSLFQPGSSSDPVAQQAASSPSTSPANADPHAHRASEETWFEFLRDGSGRESVAREPTLLLPVDQIQMQAPSQSAETRMGVAEPNEARKRRLTAPDSSGRTGYGPSLGPIATSFGAGGDGGEAASSRTPIAGHEVVDLTGESMRPLQQPLQQSHQRHYRSSNPLSDNSHGRNRSGSRTSGREPMLGRRESDIVLPPWQPDSEVSKCPVCGKQFSFLHRKHHCRKCGRVVCGTCSTHRIRIPRQFIVQPPSPIGLSFVDLTEDDDDEYNQALVGGEEVRVCNPCVPDPNFSPPPQPVHPGYLYNSGSLPFGTSNPLVDGSRNPPLPAFQTQAGFIPHHRPSLSDISGSRMDLSRHRAHDPLRVASLAHHRAQLPEMWIPQRLNVNQDHSPHFFPHATVGSSHSHRHTASSSSHRSSPSRYRPGLDPSGPFPPFLMQQQGPPSPPLPTVPPRRQIPEEDECPVCGNELPHKGPNGDETDREAHVMECIETSYAPVSSCNPSSAPNTTEMPAPAVAAGSSTTPPPADGRHSAPPGAPGSMPQRVSSIRARRHTGNRMLVYRATEKDCIGDDGETQECVICFEEFEEGVEMGRLECLCKFHRSCIRKWWETKGVGSCPTHQLHD